jgi:hypothetical protein
MKLYVDRENHTLMIIVLWIEGCCCFISTEGASVRVISRRRQACAWPLIAIRMGNWTGRGVRCLHCDLCGAGKPYLNWVFWRTHLNSWEWQEFVMFCVGCILLVWRYWWCHFQVDPAGWVPKCLVNMLSSKLVLVIDDMYRLAQSQVK